MTKKFLYTRIPVHKNIEVPENILLIAERRTHHLEGVAMRKTLKELLADAYMQGVHDMADAVERHELRRVLRSHGS